MGEAERGEPTKNRRAYDRLHGLVLDYLLGLIVFTGNFYRENELIIQEVQRFGVWPKHSVEDADAESISFFADLFSQAKNETLKRNLLEHIVIGRLPLNRLKDLHQRLYQRSDGRSSKISRGVIDRIVIFVWKALGLSSNEISEKTGLNKKTIRNNLTHIYQIFVPDNDGLTPQKRHALLLEAAVEEGFIYPQSRVPEKGLWRDRANLAGEKDRL